MSDHRHAEGMTTCAVCSGNLSADPKVGMGVLNNAARLIDEGKVSLPGPLARFTEVRGLLGGDYLVRIMRCDPVASEMFGATTISGDDLVAYQLVWPDKQRRWPDDPEWNPRIRQPLFPLGAS